MNWPLINCVMSVQYICLNEHLLEDQPFSWVLRIMSRQY